MSIAYMTAVWQHSQAKGTALLIMLALADNANEQGRAWPSLDDLARRARCNERTVRYTLDELCNQGEIEQLAHGGGRSKQRGREGSQGVTSLWQICLPAMVENSSRYGPANGANVELSAGSTWNRGSREPSSTEPSQASLIATPSVATPQNGQSKSDVAAEVARRVFAEYKARVQHKAVDPAASEIATCLKVYTEAQLMAAIDHFARSHWWMQNNATRGAKWFFQRRIIEQLVNLDPDADNRRRATPARRNGGYDPDAGETLRLVPFDPDMDFDPHDPDLDDKVVLPF